MKKMFLVLMISIVSIANINAVPLNSPEIGLIKQQGLLNQAIGKAQLILSEENIQQIKKLYNQLNKEFKEKFLQSVAETLSLEKSRELFKKILVP